MANLQDTTINDTGFITMPSGNNAQRPAPTVGMLRYNTQSVGALEFYDGVNWRPVTGISKGAVGTGGQTITYGNGGIVHMFTTVGNHTFTPAFTGTVQVLVVAGGGGSGYDWCGGGGGGGMLYDRSYPVSAGAGVGITVGSGGVRGGGSSQPGGNGGNSIFGAITSTGGGGSGCWNNVVAQPGGSGGGGGNGDLEGSRGRIREGDGTTGQGFPGGSGVRFNAQTDNTHSGGGGGGAGGRGQDSSDSRQSEQDSQAGGPGAATSILGPTLYFGGGGGGGCHLGAGQVGGAGGVGGGGGGGIYHGGPYRPGDPYFGRGGRQSLNDGQQSAAYFTRADGGAGGANSGGGAGGGQFGNAGGSGVVIVRY